MVTVRVAGELVAVRAPKDFRATIGDPVKLSVPSKICHLFDAETGARVGLDPEIIRHRRIQP